MISRCAVVFTPNITNCLAGTGKRVTTTSGLGWRAGRRDAAKTVEIGLSINMTPWRKEENATRTYTRTPRTNDTRVRVYTNGNFVSSTPLCVTSSATFPLQYAYVINCRYTIRSISAFGMRRDICAKELIRARNCRECRVRFAPNIVPHVMYVCIIMVTECPVGGKGTEMHRLLKNLQFNTHSVYEKYIVCCYGDTLCGCDVNRFKAY